MRRRSTPQSLALRARIVLACAELDDEGLPVSTKPVAEELGVTRQTVASWRRRFLADRLEGLSESRVPVGRAPSRTSRWPSCLR